jgi:hypothetical protein
VAGKEKTMSRTAGKYEATRTTHADGDYPHVAVDSEGRTLQGAATAARPTDVDAVLASAARTTLQSETMVMPPGCGGVIIFVKVTVDPATADITPGLAYVDATAGDVRLWDAAAAISAVGTFTYLVHPLIGATEAGNVTENVPLALPSAFTFKMDVADADSMTYSVSAVFLPSLY